MTLSFIQLVIGAVIVVLVVLALVTFMEVIEVLLTEPEDTDCRIVIDQWGMRCDAHGHRIRGFGDCPQHKVSS